MVITVQLMSALLSPLLSQLELMKWRIMGPSFLSADVLLVEIPILLSDDEYLSQL